MGHRGQSRLGSVAPVDYPGIKHLGRLTAVLTAVDRSLRLVHRDLTGNVLFSIAICHRWSSTYHPTGVHRSTRRRS